MRTRNSALLFWSIATLFSAAMFASASGPVYIYGGPFDLSIPAETSASKGLMQDAVINISEHLFISDLDVAIDIAHTNIFDLEIMLQGPGGQSICLNAYYDANDFFGGQNYSRTIFDDEAALTIDQGSAPFTGRFKPKDGNLLSTFDEADAFGQWRLQINDLYYDDKGTLENFELMITVPEPATFLLFGLSGFSLRRRCRS